uniref:Uncharacterized protein n=1 Tax=Physcomitrium patens TaxID=3218 RepID=A0A2K1K3F9_PHYPA|nr:hypothetical protein PHYPA_012780 [Physcomitrium patens]
MEPHHSQMSSPSPIFVQGLKDVKEKHMGQFTRKVWDLCAQGHGTNKVLVPMVPHVVNTLCKALSLHAHSL